MSGHAKTPGTLPLRCRIQIALRAGEMPRAQLFARFDAGPSAIASALRDLKRDGIAESRLGVWALVKRAA